jgi:hypothetical protein
MNRRTRYFVIASLLVLAVGIGAGLVAYFAGFPTAFAQQGPDELQLVPRNAALVAYAAVNEVMVSNLRQRVRQSMPDIPDGQGEFQEQTGINIETDIDRVVAAIVPAADAAAVLPSGLIVASGQFDAVRIEGLMREHGAIVEDYKGRRLLVNEQSGRAHNLSLAFVEPGLIALGTPSLVRGAIDRRDGGESVRQNDEIMGLVRSLERGNVWAVGQFDALTSHANLPARVAAELPPITWFAVSGRVNGGLLGDLRVQTRDEASATQFRDVVRGIIALGQLQADTHPELQVLLRSLQLGGTGHTVALSFELPAELFDLLAKRPQLQ